MAEELSGKLAKGWAYEVKVADLTGGGKGESRGCNIELKE